MLETDCDSGVPSEPLTKGCREKTSLERATTEGTSFGILLARVPTRQVERSARVGAAEVLRGNMHQVIDHCHCSLSWKPLQFAFFALLIAHRWQSY